MIQALQAKTLSASLPAWYQCYFLAVLEADESKMLIQMERATKTILDRLAQLRSGAPEYPHEFQDLNDALTYLSLLSSSLDPELGGSNEFHRTGIPKFARPGACD